MKENKRNIKVLAIGNGKEKLNLANIEKTKIVLPKEIITKEMIEEIEKSAIYSKEDSLPNNSNPKSRIKKRK